MCGGGDIFFILRDSCLPTQLGSFKPIFQAMNKTAKKRRTIKLLLLMGIVMAGLSITLGMMNSSIAQRKNYKAFAMEFASAHEWVSFGIAHEHYKDGAELWKRHSRVILHYDKENPGILVEYLSEDGKRVRESFWMDKDKFVGIDHDSQEIVQYADKKLFWDDYRCFGFWEFIPNTFFYLGYYLHPMRKKLGGGLMTFLVTNVKGQESVVVKGEPYNGFHGTSRTMYSYDPKSDKRVPIYDKVFWFVNEKTKALDSVFSLRYPLEYENRKEFVSVRNMSFPNRQHYIDSVFNLDKLQYKNYSFHDSKNPPLSRSYSGNKNATDDLLNYTIEKLGGGKTSIAENDGWILLNFWSVNCPPCVAHLKEMGHEKESSGDYLLESKGVKILAINHRSDNVELIRSIAEKTNTSPIVFYAKGMGGVINIPALGYYYLISPDRQIVYETYNLGDYSELLEAKANYEKQRQNQ